VEANRQNLLQLNVEAHFHRGAPIGVFESI
jgi:hypothetical protein